MRYVKASNLFTLTLFTFYSYATTSLNLSSCLNITNNNQRLACYDAIAKAQNNLNNKSNIIPAVKAKTHAIVQKQQPIKVSNKAQLVKQFGQKNKPQQMAEQVEFIIKSAKLNARKKWRLSFENGQVWHATESGLRLKVGTKVIIKQGALNSFLLKKKGSNRSIRVKRIK